MSVNDLAGFNGLAAPKAEMPDAARYRALLGDCDLTEEQANELLGILYDIMRSFVELGFDVDSCGQMLEDLAKGSASNRDDVES